jgi:hypothetical protein
MPGHSQQTAVTNPPPSLAPAVKPLLVGYLPAYQGASLAGSLIGLDLSRMTHLNIAFGNPPQCSGPCTAQSDMTFSLHGQSDPDIDAFVAAAHAAGVKVLLSIGGGGGDQRIIQFYNAGLSAPLVASLDKFVRAHQLDGVDLDIEDPSNMGAPFATLVSTLASTFHPEGKLVSAAVALWLQGSMPDAALHQFDFINVMNYSSCAAAVTALQFYAQNKKYRRIRSCWVCPFSLPTPATPKKRTTARCWPHTPMPGGSMWSAAARSMTDRNSLMLANPPWRRRRNSGGSMEES